MQCPCKYDRSLHCMQRSHRNDMWTWIEYKTKNICQSLPWAMKIQIHTLTQVLPSWWIIPLCRDDSRLHHKNNQSLSIIQKIQPNQEEKQKKEEAGLRFPPLCFFGRQDIISTQSLHLRNHLQNLNFDIVVVTYTLIACHKNAFIHFPINSLGRDMVHRNELHNIIMERWSWTFCCCSHEHASYPTKTPHSSDGPCHLILKCTQHLACIESLGLKCLKNQPDGNKKFRYSELLDDWSNMCLDCWQMMTQWSCTFWTLHQWARVQRTSWWETARLLFSW